MTAFDEAWDLMKAIGPKSFRYSQSIAPVLVNRTNPFTGDSQNYDEAGLEIIGRLGIDEAVRHLEDAEDVETFARKHGYDEGSAEMYDDESDEYHMQDPKDWLYDREWDTEIPVSTQQMLARGTTQTPTGKRRPYLADELRENLQPQGRLWGEGFGSLNQRALLDVIEESRDEGAKTTPVSSATTALAGHGSMVDVNPAFRGLGLGSSTLAAILENTGRVYDTRLSPGGFALANSMKRQLDDEGIGHKFHMDRRMETPVMDEQSQIRDWRHADARYPHQGRFEMKIDPSLRGTGKVLPVSPKKIGWQPTTLNRIIEGEDLVSEEEMRELVERAKKFRAVRRGPRDDPLGEGFPWLDNIKWE